MNIPERLSAGITVTELNRLVADALRREPRLRVLTVRGEISGFKNHLATGHWYFSLKDPGAAIACVMFRTNTLKVKPIPREGDSVVVEGYVDLFPQQGRVQLYVTAMRPAGLGDLYVQLEALKARLAAEGLFDPARKKPLPLCPRKVAVVTSESGAALHDILNVSRQRCPSIPIVLIPTTVQGAGAGEEIARGVRLAAEATDAEVVIVARGGGSAEDLWCFNDECVARAVAACPLPVVSGVGHEVDVTLCDLAADVRASTPSNAAELVFPDQKDLARRVGLVRQGLFRAAEAQAREAENRMRELLRRLSALSPERRIAVLTGQSALYREKLTAALRTRLESRASAVQAAQAGLEKTMQLRLQDAASRLSRLKVRLSAVNPLAVLQRGYALVYGDGEQLVTSAQKARETREMTLAFADGRVRVIGKEETGKEEA